MTLRTDHVAGAFFIGLGIVVIALSGDLPIGSLSSPGAGFLPDILAVLTMFFGATLAARASESPAFATLNWTDLSHAASVIVAVAAATALFERLGFLIMMLLMMMALLVAVERRRVLPAAVYSLGTVLVTYLTFEYVLKTPLVAGPLGF